MRRNEQMKILS